MGVSKKTVLLIWLGIILLIVGKFIGLNASIFILYNAVIIGMYIVDLRISPAPYKIKVERQHRNILEIGKTQLIILAVHNESMKDISMKIIDSPPQEIECGHKAIDIICPAQKTVKCEYNVFSPRRGNYVFHDIYVRYKGVLGLCTRQFKVECKEEIPVYPDLEPFKKYQLMANRRLLSKDDSAVHKIFGIGTDFQGLREYSSDDEYRKINWKATARMHKLITGIYNIEKSQNIIIALDTGRTMISPAGGKSRLDHSIEAALALGQVAVSMGDYVGMVAFDSDIKLFLSPSKAKTQMQKILESVYWLQPRYCESNMEELVSYLQMHQRKRSLICIFSYVEDEESAKEKVKVLSTLAKKHSVLMISVLNPGIFKIIDAPSKDEKMAYEKAAAVYRTSTMQKASAIMSSFGIPNVLVPPNKLVSETINKYIAIKKQMKI